MIESLRSRSRKNAPVFVVSLVDAMKTESVMFAIAGVIFGLIAGWVIGAQQATLRAPAARPGVDERGGARGRRRNAGPRASTKRRSPR